MRQKDFLDFDGLLALTVPFSWNELPSNSPLLKPFNVQVRRCTVESPLAHAGNIQSEHLPRPCDVQALFPVLTLCGLTSSSLRTYCGGGSGGFHFADEETEVQRAYVTCSRLHRQEVVSRD